jgi:hypothetical protein
VIIPSGSTTWQSDPNSSPTSPARSKTAPAKATPSQSGLHLEAIRAPPSSAKSQCGGPPTASIPKTRDQPEEPNSKRSRPAGNNASTGISRVPPTRQQLRGPTSVRPDAPHLVQAATGNARTTANGFRAGRPRPADSTVVRSGALSMRLHSTRRWQDRQHTAESGSFRSRAGLRTGQAARFLARCGPRRRLGHGNDRRVVRPHDRDDGNPELHRRAVARDASELSRTEGEKPERSQAETCS